MALSSLEVSVDDVSSVEIAIEQQAQSLRPIHSKEINVWSRLRRHLFCNSDRSLTNRYTKVDQSSATPRPISIFIMRAQF